MTLGLDLDGTLITCKEKQMSLLGVILKAYGIKLSTDTIWELKLAGYSNYDALSQLGIDKITANLIQLDWVSQIERLPWITFDKLFPDALEFLLLMSKRFDQIHLISARNNSRIGNYQLSILGLDKYFDSVTFLSSKIGQKKSDVLKNLSIDVYIGDTISDYEECLEASCESTLVSTGNRGHSFLAQNSSLKIYKSLTDIEFDGKIS